MAARDFKLKDHPAIPRGIPLMLIVLDGWGEQPDDEHNAISKANTPIMDSLKKGHPDYWRLVKAHGPAVGLPLESDMGNSEVGHNAMGAGRIYKQGAGLVDSALADGSIFTGGWKQIQETIEKGCTLHLLGLLSDGGVHARLDQVWGLLGGAIERGAKKVRLHILTDGRDVADGSSFEYVEKLEKYIEELNSKGADVKIASGGGRMAVTMDRYETDWEVVERGWHAHVLGEAPNKYTTAAEALKDLRAKDPKVNDQYYPPWVVVDDAGKSVGTIEDGDAVVIWNFRADRVVMISKAFDFEDKDFPFFDRVRRPKVTFAGMLEYDVEIHLPSIHLVDPPQIEGTSGEYLAKNHVRSYACSETVKFGHMTFFWNGNRSGYFDAKYEKYVEIPTDKGIQFNEKPPMKAAEIAETAAAAFKSKEWDFVRVNFPNADMVGHTGDMEATVVGCEAADKGVEVLLKAVEDAGGIYLVTADHGNAEEMVKHDKDGKPVLTKDGTPQKLTAHTCAPVPVAIGGPGLPKNIKLRKDLPGAGLANVAATFINLCGLEAPSDMEPTLLEVVEQ